MMASLVLIQHMEIRLCEVRIAVRRMLAQQRLLPAGLLYWMRIVVAEAEMREAMKWGIWQIVNLRTLILYHLMAKRYCLYWWSFRRSLWAKVYEGLTMVVD
jgi:hypothetical protein